MTEREPHPVLTRSATEKGVDQHRKYVETILSALEQTPAVKALLVMMLAASDDDIRTHIKVEP